jgi:hypothetical protein
MADSVSFFLKESGAKRKAVQDEDEAEKRLRAAAESESSAAPAPPADASAQSLNFITSADWQQIIQQNIPPGTPLSDLNDKTLHDLQRQVCSGCTRLLLCPSACISATSPHLPFPPESVSLIILLILVMCTSLSCVVRGFGCALSFSILSYSNHKPSHMHIHFNRRTYIHKKTQSHTHMFTHTHTHTLTYTYTHTNKRNHTFVPPHHRHHPPLTL